MTDDISISISVVAFTHFKLICTYLCNDCKTSNAGSACEIFLYGVFSHVPDSGNLCSE